MNIYDEDFNIIDYANESIGYLTLKERLIIHSWIIDSPEVGSYEIVAQYPNGGKDMRYVVSRPEEGHWETKDYNNNSPVLNFDYSKFDNVDKSQPIVDVEYYQLYHVWTEEELQQKLQNDKESKEIQAFYDSLQETIIAQDAAICELYEMTLGA